MTRYDALLALIDRCGVAPGIGSTGNHYQMQQSPVELAQFLVICEEHDVSSMLELGTGEYGGLARLCYAQLGWAVTSIDRVAPLHESGRFILGDTSDPDVYAKVKDQRFDLVFIDAGHDYKDVKHDYDWYAPLADQLVSFHDVAPNREGTEGVGMVWASLQWVKHAIIDPQHPIGIGYYEVGV